MTQYAWHVHHEQLFEALEEGGLEERTSAIKTNKPKSEQALRLRLLKMTSPKLNPLVDKYNADRKLLVDKYNADRKLLDDKFYSDWKLLADKYYSDRKPLADKYDADWKLLDDKFYADRKLLVDKYDADRKLLMKDIEALHAVECPDCPWNGRTIFA